MSICTTWIIPRISISVPRLNTILPILSFRPSYTIIYMILGIGVVKIISASHLKIISLFEHSTFFHQEQINRTLYWRLLSSLELWILKDFNSLPISYHPSKPLLQLLLCLQQARWNSFYFESKFSGMGLHRELVCLLSKNFLWRSRKKYENYAKQSIITIVKES